jgi:hypothetical protein
MRACLRHSNNHGRSVMVMMYVGLGKEECVDELLTVLLHPNLPQTFYGHQ